MKHENPSVKKTAFNCPHCDAYAHQHWYSAGANPMKRNDVPFILQTRRSFEGEIRDFGKEQKMKPEQIERFIKNVKSGAPFIDTIMQNNYSIKYSMYNIWYSRCYNCDNFSVWIGSKIIYPISSSAPLPNPDLPADVLEDYNEAAAILHLSPRAAAALLRLVIQKMCAELGAQGETLHKQIGYLVKIGLNSNIQKALDAVRVIGNNAVHPGKIDVSDDIPTVNNLFSLVNMIADEMITKPKRINDVYESLPESDKISINKRDK